MLTTIGETCYYEAVRCQGCAAALLPAWFAVALLTAAPVPAPAAGARPRPNVILVSIDTLRADRVGAYGCPRPTTPRLDAFARDAVLFENVVSAAPWTLPSHMTMFTGLYPSRHGLTDYPREFSLRGNLAIAVRAWRSEGWRGLAARFLRQARWRPHRFKTGIPTLAEILRDAGYRTAGFAATDSLRGSFGFERGFEVYDNVPFRPGSEQVRLALDWADRHREGPFFLFLHLYDAHGSFGRKREDAEKFGRQLMYGGPEPFRGMFDDGRRSRFHGSVRELFSLFRHGRLDKTDIRYLNALYDEGVRYADSILGGFLDGLKGRGLYDGSVILVTSDHGEALMVEHPDIHHDCILYRELVHVPMVLKLQAGAPAGRRIEGLARTIDYLPTLLGAAGVPPPKDARWQGSSLLPRIAGRGAQAENAYSETHCADFAPPVQALERADGWKAIFRPYTNRIELYDLRRDPHESLDLSSSRPEAAGELEEELLRHNGVFLP